MYIGILGTLISLLVSVGGLVKKSIGKSIFIFVHRRDRGERREKTTEKWGWLRQKLHNHCIFYPLRSLRALRLNCAFIFLTS
jgi:hypothetical protein